MRDKLREDAGISTDAERLPQLTWMLFLKFLDDHEKAQEDELGHRHVPVIEAPYRWRDWAMPADIQTARKGDDLLTFVNTDLFEYLRKRSGGGQNDLREIVGKVFRGTYNLVRSGYILREVVETLSGINFNSSDDVHIVSHFYETMLKEMRDASGKSGEYYTPRPLVRLIIDRLTPKLGDRILDPACGTCGFLAEAYERLKPEAKTPAARKALHENIMGIEKRTMPYLLGVVNLLLHGIDQPALDERNTLSVCPTSGFMPPYDSGTRHPFLLRKPVEHQVDHSQLDECLRRSDALLSVLAQPTASPQPRERPLHRPPNRQQHPAHCILRALHDVQLPRRIRFYPFVEYEIVVLAVRVHSLDMAHRLTVQAGEQLRGRLGVIDTGRGHQDGHQ